MTLWASNVVSWPAHSHSPPSATLDGLDLQPLYDLLVPVKMFGSAEAARLAEDAINAVWKYIESDSDDYSPFRAAETALLRQIRIDLDIAPGDPPRHVK